MPRAAPVTTTTFPLSFMLASMSLRRYWGADGYGGPPVLPIDSAFPREHLVHHLAGEPEIGRRVAHLLELSARQVAADLFVLRQQVDQRLVGPRHLPADVVDEVVRALATEMRAETHHDGFGDDGAPGEIEIGPHAVGVDLESRQHELGLRQRAGGQEK